MEKKFPSKQKVKCPYKSCQKEIRQDNLKDHLKSIHGVDEYKDPRQRSVFEMIKKKPEEQVQETGSGKSDREASSSIMVDFEDSGSSVAEMEDALAQMEALSKQLEEKHDKSEQQRALKEFQSIAADIPVHDLTETEKAGEQVPEIFDPEKTITNEEVVEVDEAPSVSTSSKPDEILKHSSRDCDTSSKPSTSKFSIPDPKAFHAFFKTHKKKASYEYEDDEVMEIGSDISSHQAKSQSHTTSSIASTTKSRFGLKKLKRILPSLSRPSKTRIVNVPQQLELNEALEEINEKLDQLQLEVKQIRQQTSGKPQEPAKEPSQPPSTTRSCQSLKFARSIDQILDSSQYLQCDMDGSKLYCNVCCDEKGKEGIFVYNFDTGCSFESSKIPKEFANLKTTLRKHLKTKTHITKADDHEKMCRLTDKQKKRNYKCGMLLGREAYKILKTSSPYLNYELNLAILHEEGVDVGDINHSRKFVAEFGMAAANVLQKQQNKLLHEIIPATGRPTPVAVISDKITPNRRTLQIVGFHGFINGRIQSLVAGVVPLCGETGEKVTKSLETGLENLRFEPDQLKSRLVGGALDGDWDPAQILELAEANARSGEEDISNVLESVNSICKKVQNGKSYREMLMEAYEEDRVRVPGRFSDTRFATYSSTVIKQFLHNYKFYYNFLSKRSENEELFQILDNPTFLLSLSALSDIYEDIGITSRQFQKPDLSPWNIARSYDEGIEEQQKKLDFLNSEEKLVPSMFKANFPTLYEAYHSLEDYGEYNECPISESKSAYKDSLEFTRKSLSSFVSKYINNLQRRREDEVRKNPTMVLCKTLFDVATILDRFAEPYNDDLTAYYNLAVKAGALSSEISVEQVQQEYSTFSDRVREIAPAYKRIEKPGEKKRGLSSQPQYNDMELYYKILKTEYLYRDIPNALHLCLSAMCRTSCEAVVEGMGSVLKLHSQNRGNLDLKKIENETIIRWQGPSPAKGCSSLIEQTLDSMFNDRSGWHFVTQDPRVKFHVVSEVIDRVNKEQVNKISFD